MKRWQKKLVVILFLGPFILAAVPMSRMNAKWKMPYHKVGLTKNQAAQVLLSRFTYGALPGQAAQIEVQGLEAWFEAQLISKNPEEVLDQKLITYDILKMNNEEIVAKYPNPGTVLREAITKGLINVDSLQKGSKAYQHALNDYMKEQGVRRPADLQRQFASQKVARAVYTTNQLQEVMTSFWFNHFNVSMTNNRSALFIPSFERDVIRPNTLGKFNTLLLETAKSPAMLFYLDNFSSASDSNSLKRKQYASMAQKGRGENNKKPVKRKSNGLNENYARELMELHTLGVDGGYSQKDVTEAARILTGWTVRPMGSYEAKRGSEMGMNPERARIQGIVKDKDFIFTHARHDEGEKNVLGRVFPANRGYEEGHELLNMLAEHPATAQFICKKIAIRFVSDEPSATLVNKMVTTFKKEGGDIRSVLRTMVQAKEFWAEVKSEQKIKSPFELAIGAVRNLNAELLQPYELFTWISRMGEKLYYYQAPTGFPDNGAFWINTGSLLNRMNFGLALASGKMPGINVNLINLNKGHEPESAKDALSTYAQLLMPGRDLEPTLKRLTPLLTDPTLSDKLERASKAVDGKESSDVDMKQTARKSPIEKKTPIAGNPEMLAQVVGLILGSPEYQKR